jgi:flagellar M-ring protein FliF
MGVGSGEKALLYSGLELTEAAEMLTALEQAGIDAEQADGGATIRVPADQVDSARMLLAQEGLPTSGSVGYEIFDSQDGFGATQFVQNVNRVRALEGELARTIRSLEGVSSARVHLALPERRLFNNDAEAAKASVWIELRQGDLAARHARAIRNLVANAVPGLQSSNVTILDQEGRLLARGEEGGDEAAYSALADERKMEVEERLRRNVVSLIESVVGRGGVEVQVTADVNFDRITESSEIFDPNGQVVRSTSTIEEDSNESDATRNGAASASAAIPDGTGSTDGAGSSQAAARRTEETINYEVSRTTRTEVREAGAIQRISLAIAVDGVTGVDDAGAETWTPRTPEELERIEALAKSAIGFDEARGDKVEIANIRFARAPAPLSATGAPSAFQFDKNDIMRGAELGVLVVVAAMIIFLVARPLLKTLPGGGGFALAGGGAGGGGSVGGGSGDGELLSLTGGQGPGGLMSAEEKIDVAQIEGKVRASSVRKVAEIVDAHPEDSVAILRTWLHGAS